MAQIQPEFDGVRSLMRELQDRKHLLHLIQWHRAAYPRTDARMVSSQEAFATQDRHLVLTGDNLGQLLEQLDRSALSDEQTAMIRVLEREREIAIRVPSALAAEIARVGVEAKQAWDQARAERRWTTFAPAFQRVVDLARAKAETAGYRQHPMDVWFDEFEPGLTTQVVAGLLHRLEEHVAPLVERGARAGNADWTIPSVRAVVRGGLKEFLLDVCQRLGFDPTQGYILFGESPRVLDAGPGAIRVFLHGQVEDATAYLRSVCHEMGHAMYEQGLPYDWTDTPLGDAPSLTFNEALAAFWENHVCRSADFWRAYAEPLGAVVGDLAGIDPQRFYRACNRIHVGEDVLLADEFTHIGQTAIRFEIESLLLTGQITAQDVPDRFSELLGRRFGVAPSSDQVFLQDLQWPYGYFGYLSLYTVSRVYAAWLFETACVELGGENLVAQWIGDRNFLRLNEWLQVRIYGRGAMLDSRALLAEVTGTVPDGAIDPAAYLRHLDKRCGELYG
jgi:carboxypeptidase Taq